MPRSARRLLIASLVVLHAALMSCGPCFHALPGSGHESALGMSRGGDRGRDPAERPHRPAEDCPVCHFFAQAQLPVEVAAVAPAQFHAEAGPRAAPPCPVLTSRTALRPRAPPFPVAAPPWA